MDARAADMATTDELSSLLGAGATLRVSSVLQNAGKRYGKQHLVDGSDETCWNSDAGRPQFIQVTFAAPVVVRRVVLVFQGGFVGKDCEMEGALAGERFALGPFFPANSNAEQAFDVDAPRAVDTLILRFNDSTDFYGRITVYKLDVLGERAQQ